jgi:uncharacterized Zn finger protein
MEFLGRGPRPAHFFLTSSAAVSCTGCGPQVQTIHDVIQQMLEDELVEATHDGACRVVVLRFRQGAQVEFSNSNHEGGDNAAIVTNLADNSWQLFA